MKFKSLLIASLLAFSTNVVFGDVAVPYGEGSGKVDYFNYIRFPKLGDPYPSGPASFRSVGDSIWIADSNACKLMEYNSSGKLLTEFSVLPKNLKSYIIDEKYNVPRRNMYIEDFAPVYDSEGKLISWWIIDRTSRKLLNFSLDGNKIAEINCDEFRQPFRIEVGKAGHLFIADKATRSIFIFTSEGKWVDNINWEWSGMAVAGADEKLYRLMYISEERKNMLVCTNLKGKVVKTQLLKVNNTLNPRLWWVDEEKGECVFSYTPGDGFKGSYKVVRVGLDGVVRGEGEITAPIKMNRFIDRSEYGYVYISKCNYFKAPEGNFEIVPYKLP